MNVYTRYSIRKQKEVIEKAREQIRLAEQKIYEIRKNCPHEEIQFGESWTERISRGGIIAEEWEERVNTCNDCGHTWHQQAERWGDFEGNGLD